MSKNRIISSFLIQGCFLALITVLSPFGFYSNANQSLAKQTRTELVENNRNQLLQVHVADCQSNVIAYVLTVPSIDYGRRLTIMQQRVLRLLKQVSTGHIKSPIYYHKTIGSTTSEDEPLSAPDFA